MPSLKKNESNSQVKQNERIRRKIYFKNIDHLFQDINTQFKISKDIFETTEQYLKFLLYLYSKPYFLLAEVNKIFKVGYSLVVQCAQYWEDTGLLIKMPISKSTRAQTHKYSLSETAREKVDNLIQLINEIQ